MANEHGRAGLGLGRKRLLPGIHPFGSPRKWYELAWREPRCWHSALFAVDAAVRGGLMHCVR